MKYINPPAKCDICEKPITDVFYDANCGRYWANVCPDCFGLYSLTGKTGTGLGQCYAKHEDGLFYKTGE